MQRRGFLLALAGSLGAAAVAGSMLTPAQATTLSQLKDFPLAPEGAPEDALAEDVLAEGDAGPTTPDGTPVEQAQWGPPRGYYRRRRRRQRRVCRRVWRRGRPVRVCRWVWY